MSNVYKIGIIVDGAFAGDRVVYNTIKNIYDEYKDRDDIVLKFNIMVDGMTECIKFIIQQLLQYYPPENIVKVDENWILDVLKCRHKNFIPRGYFANNDALMYKERDKLFLNGCSRILLFTPRYNVNNENKLNELFKKIDLENKRIRKYNDDIIKQQKSLSSKGIKRRPKSLKNEKYVTIIYDI